MANTWQSVVLAGALLGATTSVFAQATASIAGEIVDAASRKPITSAQVTLRGTALRAVTDLSGSFTIRSVPPGQHAVDVRKIGYEPLARDSIMVSSGEVVRLSLTMTPAAFRLAEVTVTPGSFSLLEVGPVGRQTLSRAEIETAPFGEDLFRSLNRLPGLSSGDYGAHFSIRGGRHDETLILLDGLEIYEPFHLKDFNEGALSIFDVDAIDGVELLTGGFSTHYGDKRSGVMNISTRWRSMSSTPTTGISSESTAPPASTTRSARERQLTTDMETRTHG